MLQLPLEWALGYKKPHEIFFAKIVQWIDDLEATLQN